MQLMSIKIGLLSVLLIKTCVRKKGGLGGFAPQTLTRSYYFEPPLSKKRSRATGRKCARQMTCIKEGYNSFNVFPAEDMYRAASVKNYEKFSRFISSCRNMSSTVCRIILLLTLRPLSSGWQLTRNV